MRGMPRRDWLKGVGAAALLGGPLLPTGRAQPRGRDKLPVAAVVTVYTNNSHADVIVGKILEGFQQDGGPGPNLRLATLYADQVPAGDMSRRLAEQHGFQIAQTIDAALTGGGDQLEVAGVLSIGEHGNYPYTPDTRQHMYPRRRFFDEIVASFRRAGQVAPLFNDKHLSYAFVDARHMFDTARQLEIPFLAGSSLPVTWRVPPLELPLGSEIEASLGIGYGGLESYGFHALETHQCMVERRRGGETGVAAVQAVRGDAIWRAESKGRWSRELFDALLKVIPDVPAGDPRQRLGENAAFYLIEYRDGLKATVAMANGVARHFGFAVKLRGRRQPLATWFKLQDGKPYGHFAYLLRAIEHTVHTRTAAYPVERTLLTTGILDRAMHSLAADGQRWETPELAISYQPRDWPFAREEGEG